MKTNRSYFFSDGNKVFCQRSVFFVEDEPFGDPLECLCQAYVSPILSGDRIDGAVLQLLVKDSEFPLDFSIQEMQHFLNVLKTLYYGS